MYGMYTTYEVIRSNKEEATERTLQKLQMTRVTFSSNDWRDFDLGLFDLEMDRNTPWAILVPIIKQIRQIGTELRSRHAKKCE